MKYTLGMNFILFTMISVILTLPISAKEVDFNGDGKADVYVISSDSSNSHRPLISSGSSFEEFCTVPGNEFCGILRESFVNHPQTLIIPGDYSGNGKSDLLLVSGNPDFPRRALLLSQGDGFVVASSCVGVNDGVCGFDTEPYMFHPYTRLVPGYFNSDNKLDVLVISGDPSFPRRTLLISNGSSFSEASGCSGNEDGACGFDTEPYMFHPRTKLIPGDFNGDSKTDVLVISGDINFPRRALLISNGSSFSEANSCIGNEDGACGFDTEPYMFHPDTKLIPGDFNGDSKTDVLVISGDINFPRRALLISNGSSFSELSGCIGNEDGACGFDTEPYMFNAYTKIIPGYFNADNKLDVLVVSGDPSFSRRALLISNGSVFSEASGCIGNVDGACGFDTEFYMFHPHTKMLPGDFNGDGMTDLLVFSGDIRFPRRVLLISNGSSFSEASGCIGESNNACGIDNHSFPVVYRNRLLSEFSSNKISEQFVSTFPAYPDITISIQWAINSGASKIIFDGSWDTIYVSETINLKSNLELNWYPGVILEAKANSFTEICENVECPSQAKVLLNAELVENLTLQGGDDSMIRMLKHEYTIGEHRHAVNIIGSKNVTIRGLKIADSGGDGIYLGTKNNDNILNTNVLIENVVSDNNARNGLSITGADGVMVRNSIFSNSRANGQAAINGPSAGIDLEPNNSGQQLLNIEISNNQFISNRYYGILVANPHYTDTATNESSVAF